MPVWEALSTLFLDTDTSLGRTERAEALAASPYAIGELEAILRDEVFPVCSWNLFSVAGEWSGFDRDRLREAILRRARRRRGLRLGFGDRLVTRSREWRRTQDLVAQLREKGGRRPTPPA